MPEIAPSRCPLCGSSNRCVEVARQAGKIIDNTPCWCDSISIANETLKKIPAAAKNKVCLCPQCAGLTKDTGSTNQVQEYKP